MFGRTQDTDSAVAPYSGANHGFLYHVYHGSTAVGAIAGPRHRNPNPLWRNLLRPISDPVDAHLLRARP